jgi:hypothetical protein
MNIFVEAAIPIVISCAGLAFIYGWAWSVITAGERFGFIGGAIAFIVWVYLLSLFFTWWKGHV